METKSVEIHIFFILRLDLGLLFRLHDKALNNVNLDREPRKHTLSQWRLQKSINTCTFHVLSYFAQFEYQYSIQTAERAPWFTADNEIENFARLSHTKQGAFQYTGPVLHVAWP